MHASGWITFIRQLPQSVHDNLIFITRIGYEVTVQNIFRMEPDYVVLRGRLSGTTNEGRIFVLPFDEVHAIGFQKPMKEHEVDALLSGRDPRQAAAPKAVENADAAAAPGPAPDPAAAPANAAQEPPPAKATQPAPSPASAPAEAKDTKPPPKVNLLERVRARLAAANEGKTTGTS